MIVKKQLLTKAAAKPALTGAATTTLGQDPYYFTVKELKQMCENQGISTRYFRIKDDYIDALFKKQTGFTMVVKPHES